MALILAYLLNARKIHFAKANHVKAVVPEPRRQKNTFYNLSAQCQGLCGGSFQNIMKFILLN
jgi:hypothetical protein